MNIKFSLILATALTLGFTGCGDDSSSGGGSSSNANSTKLTWNDTQTEFVIKTTIGNVSDYYHVKHKIIDNDDREILAEGANYTGTVTTTCAKDLATGSSVSYSCVTHRETASPVGDPDDKTVTISLKDTKTYSVKMEEKVLLGETKETLIDSLVQQ